MRNQNIVNALNNAEMCLLYSEDSNLKSAVSHLLHAVKELSRDDDDYVDPPEDDNSHVKALDQFLRDQETAEYLANVAACRARAIAAFANRKVTRANPSGL